MDTQSSHLKLKKSQKATKLRLNGLNDICLPVPGKQKTKRVGEVSNQDLLDGAGANNDVKLSEELPSPLVDMYGNF
jgi:hypothetical protein